MNLVSLLLAHAKGRPDHPAIEVDGDITSYRRGVEIMGRYAARLEQAGVTAGARVGLCLRDTADHLLLHYAVAWLGATIVPVDYRWKAGEKAGVVSSFGCRLVVTEAGDDDIAAPMALAFEPAWRDVDVPVPAVIDDSDLAIVLSLSSGTTGRPTGALVSHGQLYERFISQWVGMGFNASDRYLVATPLYFGGGRSFAMSMLAAGATVVMSAAGLKAEVICATVRDRKISSLFVVPTQIRRMIEAHDEPGLAMPGLRCLVTSGAAMLPEDRQQVIRRLTPNLTDYYATSEGGGIAVLLPAEQGTFAGTVGRPAFRVEIEVVDAQGAPLPRGEVGVLRYRGPGVSTWLVDETGRATEADGWFSPGDLAVLTEGGHVRLVGRTKDMIIRGGVNIYPAEIEAVFGAHPDIREASVFGLPDKDLGEVVAVAIVVASGATLTEAAVLGYVRERLTLYKVPQRLAFVSELPRNPSGKVLKSALPDMFNVKH